MAERKINPLSEAIRLIRVYSDIKQNDLALDLDIAMNVISDMERGRRTITLKILQKYADYFNITVQTIQAFAEEIKNNKNIKKEIFDMIINSVKEGF